jgi:hypothetical protein
MLLARVGGRRACAAISFWKKGGKQVCSFDRRADGKQKSCLSRSSHLRNPVVLRNPNLSNMQNNAIQIFPFYFSLRHFRLKHEWLSRFPALCMYVHIFRDSLACIMHHIPVMIHSSSFIIGNRPSEIAMRPHIFASCDEMMRWKWGRRDGSSAHAHSSDDQPWRLRSWNLGLCLTFCIVHV